MSGAQAIMQEGGEVLFRNYRSLPLVITRGEGCRVWDDAGKPYLDFVSGIAVVNLGHCHPAVVRAIEAQARRLMHVSNLYVIPEQVKLARWLVDHSFADRAFFCNSGTEAVEGAIKLVRRHAHDAGGEGARNIILVAGNSFHGRTLGALSATMQPQYHVGFGPLVPGFTAVPFNDADALSAAITADTCAVILEPVQGEGGVIPATRAYLEAARALCTERGIPLVFDEIQTGMGRTGKLFAYEQFGVEPDVMVLAKALGNGFPVGALLARDEIAKCFTPGTHGATFGGNPLASAAALATCEALADGVIDHGAKMGALLRGKLEELAGRFPFIKEVRGMGLHLAAETDADCKPILLACMARGLLVNVIQGKILRFVPPLVVTEEEITEAMDILETVLKAHAAA
ncbi:MAG: aspartate aminotransferase family protein [Myxococcota bacterium]